MGRVIASFLERIDDYNGIMAMLRFCALVIKGKKIKIFENIRTKIPI